VPQINRNPSWAIVLPVFAMAYQVLARKWRPQNFSSLVGQEPIVTALRNALQEGKVAQAYLFSGIRGVGKTTAARVLAKALNCERGPAADPCNECTPCLEITRGADLDVIEVDAATYSKVEQVRELTESLRYGPARDRYKVVVLDEIHRLSRQAFDALLKIVEEPPPHLVFIFATTEVEAVPATILSRCQEFHFRRVSADQVGALLREIATAEEITASDTALRLIARAGEGSVRDAVALLDQLATFASGTISDQEAVRLLGGLDLTLFQSLLTGIIAGDGPAVVAAVRHIEDEGWDSRHVYGQFLVFCRDALHLALAGSRDIATIDLPAEQIESLGALAREAGYENLLRLLHQLLTSEEGVRRSETGTLAVEIAWLRAAELPKLRRVEELLAGAPLSPSARSVAPSASAARPLAPVAASRPTASSSPPRPSAPPPAAELPKAPVSAASWRDTFFEEVSKRKQALAAHLAEAQELRVADGRLVIALRKGDTVLASRLRTPANQQLINDAVTKVWGPDATWEVVESSTPPPETASIQSAAATSLAAKASVVKDNPTVQTVLEIFGGEVSAIEEHGTSKEG
jgi:DNA polymerase-3 subunit gamma/tau